MSVTYAAGADFLRHTLSGGKDQQCRRRGRIAGMAGKGGIAREDAPRSSSGMEQEGVALLHPPRHFSSRACIQPKEEARRWDADDTDVSLDGGLWIQVLFHLLIMAPAKTTIMCDYEAAKNAPVMSACVYWM